MESRSYVATEISGWSAPIQRSHAPNPAIARRSGMCSRSYQSWNSSACAPEKSNTASSRALAIGNLPETHSLHYTCGLRQRPPLTGADSPGSRQFEDLSPPAWESLPWLPDCASGMHLDVRAFGPPPLKQMTEDFLRAYKTTVDF